MEGGKVSSIPSDEEFARADRWARGQSRNLDAVCSEFSQRFGVRCPLHEVDLLPQGEGTFQIYVFFEKDKDIEAAKESGIVEVMVAFVYDALERAGRGKREEISVVFEFDSDENVRARVNGDYFLRLR